MYISDYINKWITILNEMNNDNTYKLAWGRAIIEICSNEEYNVKDDVITISFQEIGKKVLKYYWNQIFYFNLRQSAVKGPTREPKIVQCAKSLIEGYKKTFATKKPEWFNKVYPTENDELNLLFEKAIDKDIPIILSYDVCYRFPKVKNNNDIGVYHLYRKEKYIELKMEEASQLREYSNILTQLFNYKWSLLLEKYNYAPKIGNKVKGSGDEEVKRNNLQSYKKILLLQYGEEVRDFYTNELIAEDDISIDHVIPWSFIYDDDIWNLVVTSKSNNSIKSNHIVSDYYIQKLEMRNQSLLETLHDQNTNEYSKYIKDLNFAIENNTVKELYNYFNG